jgi:hypothetical protein
LVRGEVGVSMMTRVRGISNAKAVRELGWQPRYPSYRESSRAGMPDLTAPGCPHGCRGVISDASPIGIRKSRMRAGARRGRSDDGCRNALELVGGSRTRLADPRLVDWGSQGEATLVPEMRTQLVAARTVAERLAEPATDPESGLAPGPSGASISEIAGPREESLVEMARLLAARRGDPARIEGMSDPDDPDRDLNLNGALLPGPDATLAGPTFEQWLDSTYS